MTHADEARGGWRRNTAEAFVKRWKAAEGNEQREANKFWIELFSEVLGVANPTHMLDFERKARGRRIDVFYEDTEKNRILKATARILAASKNVNATRRRDLKRCLVYMGGISDMGTSRIDWKRLKYDRNNSSYLMLMNVCFMVLNGRVLSTDAGDKSAASFMDDQELHALYEKFLREYFRRHHPAIKVSAKEIDNGIENAPPFLPKLCTDITLEHGKRMLIIDAKCYGRILTLHYGTEKLNAANRNQILSYVLHAAYGNDLDVSGMLLYAQTERDRHIGETWGELGHEFRCRTLDLNREFNDIAAELDEIAAMVL